MRISALRTAVRKYCPFVSKPTDRHIQQFMVGSPSFQFSGAIQILQEFLVMDEE